MTQLTHDTNESAESCIYEEAWVGKCGDPASGSSDPPLCNAHESKSCRVCGAQAVKGCEATMGLVCGAPLCEDHNTNDCSHYW